MTVSATRAVPTLHEKLATWRAARRDFRDHLFTCPACERGPCPEGERLDQTADEAERLLPYHAVRMEHPVWVADEDLKRTDFPMAAAVGLAFLSGAVIIGIPFGLAMWPLWR